ncbi:MAG: PAS domain-containing protein [Sedimentisphaerales bacterium]|nr:PAS domain-containing protein [Sedimentisphaerales bacterium]
MTDTSGKEKLALVDQVEVQPAKPRSNKKTEVPKEMILSVLCGVILAGGGLISAIVLTVRKYQRNVSEIGWNAAWIAALLMLPAAIYSVVLHVRAYRHRKMTHAIEANLVNVIKISDDQEALKSLSAAPVGARLTEACQGWNRLLSALENMEGQDGATSGQNNLGQFLCSYDSQRLLMLIDALPDGIVQADAQGNIILANRACEGMVGRRLSEFIGTSVVELFNDGQAKETLQRLIDLKDHRADDYFEITIPAAPAAVAGVQEGSLPDEAETSVAASYDSSQDSSTSLWVSCHRQVDAGEDGGLLILMRDITQQKAKEQGRDNFISHVSHELRSPLTNIRAYTETLLSDMVLDERVQKEAFNVINEETSRLIRLVNDVLDLSRMETGSLQLDKGEVLLDRLISQCVNDIKALAGSKQITLQTNYHPKLPNLYADREKLAVVLNNILSNAVKYTPQGGTVFIETNVDERYVYIKVTDTGYGIAAEDINLIFDRFYRVNREETADIPGTGLGLATSKEIVALHGGTINVTSGLDKGSEMVVKLPLVVTGPVLGPAVKSK